MTPLRCTLFATVALLTLGACKEAPLAPAACLLRGFTMEAPAGCSLTEEALAELFYEQRPEERGKELLIQYRLDDVPGRGRAHINTHEFHEGRLKKTGLKGGGSLVVVFELRTGTVISAGLSKQEATARGRAGGRSGRRGGGEGGRFPSPAG